MNNNLPVNAFLVRSQSSYEWVVIAVSWTAHNVIIYVLSNRFCMADRTMSNLKYAVSEWRQSSAQEIGVII